MTDDGFYVQHICGYKKAQAYKDLAKIYHSAGFICLRSEPAIDKTELELVRKGKYSVNGKVQTLKDLKPEIYEIWYLPGPLFAEGPIADAAKVRTEAGIEIVLSWLMQMGPGEIVCKGQHWGLGAD